MKPKTIERLFAVLLLVVWILMLVRAHAITPNEFYKMQPVIFWGDLAVLIVVVLSLTTKRPLLAEKESKDEADSEPNESKDKIVSGPTDE
jgi:hypothetical protein